MSTLQTTIVKHPDSGTNNIRVDSNGRVGFGGADTPVGVVTIYDSTSAYLYFQNSASGTSGGDGFSILHHSSLDTFIANRDSGDIVFETGGSEAFRVNSDGKVGINCTPTEKFHVQGAVNTNLNALIEGQGTSGDVVLNLKGNANNWELTAPNSASIYGFYIKDVGNGRIPFFISGGGFVGINETSPGAPLTVKRSNTGTSGLLGGLKLKQGNATANNRISMMYSTLDDFDIAAVNGVFEAHAGQAKNCMGHLEFYTKDTVDHLGNDQTAPSEKARISRDGYFKAANDGDYQSNLSYHEFSQTKNEQGMIGVCHHTGFTENMFIGRTVRAASHLFSFAALQSGFGTSLDSEFILRGDGSGYADGSWNGGGADYAEYFEWLDGNANNDDRRGIAIVLDGEKIREAVEGEDPIGVISGNPSVVGDAAWNHWKGKNLRDDFGTYIQEDYEVEGDDGNPVIQQRRKVNPDFDPELEYVTREDRPEWGCVGLMGKLRVRKGQVTGTRWIKMRDVSDSVEEWLVR